MKLRLWLFTIQFDDVHFVQFFLACHRHIPCSDAGFVAGNEILEVADLLLLAVVGSLKLGFLHGVDFLEFIVIARIAVKSAVFHMIDQVDDAVQERNIMGDQNKGIFIILEIAFQPFNVLLIQIVGRLIENQEVRFRKHQLCKGHASTFATA